MIRFTFPSLVVHDIKCVISRIEDEFALFLHYICSQTRSYPYDLSLYETKGMKTSCMINDCEIDQKCIQEIHDPKLKKILLQQDSAKCNITAECNCVFKVHIVLLKLPDNIPDRILSYNP